MSCRPRPSTPPCAPTTPSARQYLIEGLGETNRFHFHELHTLRRWLEQMPDEVRQAHPGLCLAYAIALLFTQFPNPQTPQLMARIDEALRLADEGWQKTGNQARRGEVYAFRAMIAWREGLVAPAARDARQALAWLPDDEHGRAEQAPACAECWSGAPSTWL